jgi:hypothetical protein
MDANLSRLPSQANILKTVRNHPKEWVEPRSLRWKKLHILQKPVSYIRHHPQNTTVLWPLTTIWMPRSWKGSEPYGWKFNT